MSLRNILSRTPHIGAAAKPLRETKAPGVVDSDILLHEDRISPFRNRRPGEDADRLPRRHRALRRAARRHAIGNTDRCPFGRRHIGKAHRVSIDCRICKRRERGRRNEVLD
jgi:hypothetical protein